MGEIPRCRITPLNDTLNVLSNMYTVWVRVSLFSYPLQGKIFQFFIPLATVCIFSDNSYHIMCLTFLMADTLAMSQLYFWSLVCLFWRNVHWSFKLIFIYEYIVSILYLKRFLYTLEMKSSHIHIIFKYYLSYTVNLFLLFTVSIVLKLFSAWYILISAFILWPILYSMTPWIHSQR